MRRPAAVRAGEGDLVDAGVAHEVLADLAAGGHDVDARPAGMPASSASSAMRTASSGVSGAGLSTMVQPASSAGASFDIVTNCGTFHGTIAATTPTASRRTITVPRRPGGPPPTGTSSA